MQYTKSTKRPTVVGLPRMASRRVRSFDLDLIDMSEPAQHAYRGMVPYRLTPDEKDKYWGKSARKYLKVAVHEILHTQRGPALRGEILAMVEKP